MRDALVRRSLTRKWNRKNSTETWLVWHSLATDIRILQSLHTKSMLGNFSGRDATCILTSHVWEIESFIPSPRMISYGPPYSEIEWRDDESYIRWWDAPMSKSQVCDAIFCVETEVVTFELGWKLKVLKAMLLSFKNLARFRQSHL